VFYQYLSVVLYGGTTQTENLEILSRYIGFPY
jgi:hypothetical protein